MKGRVPTFCDYCGALLYASHGDESVECPRCKKETPLVNHPRSPAGYD